jgi:MFS family permease
VLLYGALGGLLVLMPYELIQAGGYSAAAAGAALAPFPLVMALASPISGAVAGRFGARWPLVGGSALVAAGLLLATRIGPDASYWTTVLPPILVIALGMAGAAAPLTTRATPLRRLASTAPPRVREASSRRPFSDRSSRPAARD